MQEQNPDCRFFPSSALVLGASGGIGAALCEALTRRVPRPALTTLSRSGDGFDITDEPSVRRSACRLSGRAFDLIINATGALEANGAAPEKSFSQLEPSAMAAAFAVNTTGAALAYKHFLPLLRDRGRAVFATLSARVGSIEDNKLGGWMSYRASKAAQNQITRCAAIEFSRTNPQSIIVALHPGTIKTPLAEKYARGRYTASAAECANNMLNVIGALSPAQSGGFYDYSGEAISW